jgi:23S rRNA pseudouridine1911/1915/1917 synthase
MNIPIVYEDNWLLVVNKPSRLLTIPTPKEKKYTLLTILNDDLKKRGLGYRLHPCHRIDKDTSGLIIFAKGKSVQRKMMEEFKKRMVSKIYIALVHGRLANKNGCMRKAIDHKSALTRYQTLQRFRDFSFVKVQPETGRKNQIRLHFKQIGHPVVGEDRFVFRRDFKIRSNRLCLHAEKLGFPHPVTKESIHLEAEVPKHFKKFLK